MESLKKCNFDNCGKEEFLVWFCASCSKHYCESHRKDHDCVVSSSERLSDCGTQVNVETNTGSVQHLFTGIESRHENLEGQMAGKVHANVRSSTIQKDEKMIATLGKVEHAEHIMEKTKSEKQKSIARKTKIMLLRGRATGNDEIPLDERVYIACLFPISSATKCFFYSKRNTTVGGALQDIGDAHTLLAYGTPVVPDGKTLCFTRDKEREEEGVTTTCTEEVCDETNTGAGVSDDKTTRLLCQWDKSALLSAHVTEDFMELGVTALLVAESVQHQKNINSGQQHSKYRQVKEHKVKSEGDSGSSTSQYQYQKGERVVYKHTEIAIVVGVHKEEDPPYYTIQLSGEKEGSVKEKQTVGIHLTLYEEPRVDQTSTLFHFTPPSSQQGHDEGSGTGTGEGGTGNVFSIRLSSGGKVRVVENVPIAGTVADLKRLISSYTGVLPSMQKLLYKGKVLKDDGAKLRNTASVVSSSSSAKNKPLSLENNSLVMRMTMSSK